MKLIAVKSGAQREMLSRCASDAVEAARRGMTCEQAKASLAADTSRALPRRLGPMRPNRHGGRKK